MLQWTLRLTLVSAAVAAAAGYCPSPEWKQYRDKCYWLSDYGLHWDDVSNVCTTVHPDATMVSIHDAEENTFVAEEVSVYSDGGKKYSWIGLSRHNSTSSWTWTDGTPYNFSLWFDNDSDNFGGDCAMINYYSWTTWASHPCSSYHLYFICQIFAI